MDGSLGASKLRAEMEGSGAHAEMEGNNAGPIEMWAGDFGLNQHELPTTDEEHSGDPSPASRGVSTTDGGPSPAISTWDRRMRMASWGRKHRHNKSRKDSDTSGISSQDDLSSARDSGSGAEIWGSRRQRPHIPSTRPAPDVTSPRIGERSTKEQGRKGADALTQRLEGSSRHSPSQDASLPSDHPPSGDESGPERLTRRLGNATHGGNPRGISSPSSTSGVDRNKDSWPMRSHQTPPPPPPPDSPREGVSSPGRTRHNDSWNSKGTGTSTMGRLPREDVSNASASEASGGGGGGGRGRYDPWTSRVDSWATRPQGQRTRRGSSSPENRVAGGAERAPSDFF